MSTRWRIAQTEREVAVERRDDGFRVLLDGEPRQVRLRAHADGWLDLEIDGQRHRALVARAAQGTFVHIDGSTWEVAPVTATAARPGAAGAEAHLEAPMPGQVLQILVEPGQQVEAQAPLVLLEAMKMELRIRAPRAGTITHVHCAVGDVVERGQELVELE